MEWSDEKLKKCVIGIVMIIMIVISFMGCQGIVDSKPVLEKNRIIKAELTNEEANLIDGTGIDYYAVFNIELKDEFNYVYIWFDKYEYGEKTGNIDRKGKSIMLKNDSNTILQAMLTINDLPIEVSEDVEWHFSLGDDSTGILLESHKYDDFMAARKCPNNVEIKEGEESVLFGQFYQKGNNMDGMPEDLFANTDDYEVILVDIDIAYILKAQFYK